MQVTLQYSILQTFKTFKIVFTIYHCVTYFESAITVKSITSMQEKSKIFTFFSGEISNPTEADISTL